MRHNHTRHSSCAVNPLPLTRLGPSTFASFLLQQCATTLGLQQHSLLSCEQQLLHFKTIPMLLLSVRRSGDPKKFDSSLTPGYSLLAFYKSSARGSSKSLRDRATDPGIGAADSKLKTDQNISRHRCPAAQRVTRLRPLPESDVEARWTAGRTPLEEDRCFASLEATIPPGVFHLCLMLMTSRRPLKLRPEWIHHHISPPDLERGLNPAGMLLPVPGTNSSRANRFEFPEVMTVVCWHCFHHHHL